MKVLSNSVRILGLPVLSSLSYPASLSLSLAIAITRILTISPLLLSPPYPPSHTYTYTYTYTYIHTGTANFQVLGQYQEDKGVLIAKRWPQIRRGHK